MVIVSAALWRMDGDAMAEQMRMRPALEPEPLSPVVYCGS